MTLKHEATGKRLILLVDWDSANIIKRTGYKIFMGLSEGTFKVLSEHLYSLRQSSTHQGA
jgi:hypothetical protein